MKKINQSVELGQLLSTTIASVVQAQEQLDDYTLRRRQAYEAAEKGALALPPVWYMFNNVALEMELTSQVGQVKNSQTGEDEPHIFSKTLNPSSVGLYGYQASAGLRVRVDIAPQGFMTVKQTTIDTAITDTSVDNGDVQ